MPSEAAISSSARAAQMEAAVRTIIRGKDDVLRLALVCIFARGQFTADMLPSDVLGISIYSAIEQQFEFKQGPIFTNVLLADEINRTTPKTQSALLEAMNEGQVTVDAHSYPLSQ